MSSLPRTTGQRRSSSFPDLRRRLRQRRLAASASPACCALLRCAAVQSRLAACASAWKEEQSEPDLVSRPELQPRRAEPLPRSAESSSLHFRSLRHTALCVSLSLLASSSALALESLDDIAKDEASALTFSQKLELVKAAREDSALTFSQKLELVKAEREDSQLILVRQVAVGTLAVTIFVGAGAAWGMVEVNRQNLNQTVKSVVEETQAPLKADVAGLKTDVAGLKTDVAGLKTDVAGLKSTVDQILVFLQNGGMPQSAKGR